MLLFVHNFEADQAYHLFGVDNIGTAWRRLVRPNAAVLCVLVDDGGKRLSHYSNQHVKQFSADIIYNEFQRHVYVIKYTVGVRFLCEIVNFYQACSMYVHTDRQTHTYLMYLPLVGTVLCPPC